MTTEDAVAGARELFELDPERVACPYPTFAGLRQHAPVVWMDEIEAFVVTEYDLIAEVLREAETFSSRYATGPATEREMMNVMAQLITEQPELLDLATRAAQSGMSPVLLSADPPEHGRQRALVNRAFSPAAIRTIEPEMQDLANELVGAFADQGRVELVMSLARPLPMIVIAKALGVAVERMDDFIRWSDTLVAGIGKMTFETSEMAALLKTRAELFDYLAEVIDERDRDPQDDLISQIVQSRIDGERLTRAEVADMVLQFLLAGNETTAKVITTAARILATDPELADRLRADPALVTPFVEEVLRLEGPINGTYRIAKVDYELGGVTIPEGSSVWMVFASGNRDPEHFSCPNDLQVPAASKSPHLAFGIGEHFCLGASLARAEARIALQTFLARCTDIRLDGDAADLSYDPTYMLHGLQKLPLVFTPTASGPGKSASEMV